MSCVLMDSSLLAAVFLLCGCLVNCASEQDLYFIRHTHSKLVVDAANDSVTAERATGAPSQLWSFEMGNLPGMFYIVNNQTGGVLDIRNCQKSKCAIHVTEKLNFRDQQWYLNDNGRIANSLKRGHNLDLLNGVGEPGNKLILWKANGFDAAQLFHLQKADLPVAVDAV